MTSARCKTLPDQDTPGINHFTRERALTQNVQTTFTAINSNKQHQNTEIMTTTPHELKLG